MEAFLLRKTKKRRRRVTHISSSKRAGAGANVDQKKLREKKWSLISRRRFQGAVYYRLSDCPPSASNGGILKSYSSYVDAGIGASFEIDAATDKRTNANANTNTKTNTSRINKKIEHDALVVGFQQQQQVPGSSIRPLTPVTFDETIDSCDDTSTCTSSSSSIPSTISFSTAEPFAINVSTVPLPPVVPSSSSSLSTRRRNESNKQFVFDDAAVTASSPKGRTSSSLLSSTFPSLLAPPFGSSLPRRIVEETAAATVSLSSPASLLSISSSDYLSLPSSATSTKREKEEAKADEEEEEERHHNNNTKQWTTEEMTDEDTQISAMLVIIHNLKERILAATETRILEHFKYQKADGRIVKLRRDLKATIHDTKKNAIQIDETETMNRKIEMDCMKMERAYQEIHHQRIGTLTEETHHIPRMVIVNDDSMTTMIRQSSSATTNTANLSALRELIQDQELQLEEMNKKHQLQCHELCCTVLEANTQLTRLKSIARRSITTTTCSDQIASSDQHHQELHDYHNTTDTTSSIHAYQDGGNSSSITNKRTACCRLILLLVLVAILWLVESYYYYDHG